MTFLAHLLYFELIEDLLEDLVVAHAVVLRLGVELNLRARKGELLVEGYRQPRSGSKRSARARAPTLCMGTTPGWSASINWHGTAPVHIFGGGGEGEARQKSGRKARRRRRRRRRRQRRFLWATSGCRRALTCSTLDSLRLRVVFSQRRSSPRPIKYAPPVLSILSGLIPTRQQPLPFLSFRSLCSAARMPPALAPNSLTSASSLRPSFVHQPPSCRLAVPKKSIQRLSPLKFPQEMSTCSAENSFWHLEILKIFPPAKKIEVLNRS